MIHLNATRFLISCLLCAILLSCGGTPEARQGATTENQPTVQKMENTTKDLVTFRLPPDVQAQAPAMQGHLYQLMPHNTASFEVKHEFVFLEKGEPITGRLNIMVSRLNLLHLAWYPDGKNLAWSGSLMIALDKGTTINSREGHVIDLATDQDFYKFRFRTSNIQMSDRFHNDTDYQQIYREGNGKLYLNYYVFPQELVHPSKKLKKKNNSLPLKAEPIPNPDTQ